MIEVLCTDMFSKNLVTQGCSWWVSYDYKSLDVCPSYDGPLSMDFYGRIHPKHSKDNVAQFYLNDEPLLEKTYMDTSGSAVPSTISEEVAASISMKDQERKRETLYGTMIGNGGDEDG